MGMPKWLWILLLMQSVMDVMTHTPSADASPCRMLQEAVDCSALSLRWIPQKLPTHIQHLDLSRNLLQNLTDRDLPSAQSLQSLDLHANKIQFIQPGLFQRMGLLQELDLSANALDLYAALKTPVGTLTVQRLDLSANGLYTDMSDVFLSDAPLLTSLSLQGNSITKISRDTFNGSQALTNIDLHNNVIIDIEEGAFESLTGLSELDLSMNSMSCITNFNLVQLKTLNLSKNSLTNFQTSDLDLEFELLNLDLRENKLLYFPVLPRRNKLMFLDLSLNLLRSVNCSGALEELEALRDSGDLLTDHSAPLTLCANNTHQELPALLYLDLSFNQLKSVPSSFFSSTPALESLNVSNNCLESFDVEGLNSLKSLDLSSNNLQSLSIGESSLSSLELLILQGNALQSLDASVFSRLPSIRSLHLQQNRLRVCPGSACVRLASIPTLTYLYLSENELSEIPEEAFQGSPLLILDLSLNPGVDVKPRSLSGLETSLMHLSLSQNQLPSLSIDFSLFGSLKSLDLSWNRLAGVSLWSGGSSLESLNLQNNNLVTLSYDAISALQDQLRTLYVGSNPLSCCQNPTLLTLIQQNRLLVPDLANATCWISRDAQHVEMGLIAVTADHCEPADGTTVLWVSVIVVLALGLTLTLTVTFKLCHTRRHRFKRGIKA